MLSYRLQDSMRYLLNFDSSRLDSEHVRIVIIGAGLAGLSAAHQASKKLKKNEILIIEPSFDSSSFQAQGGIAVALGKEDSVESHVQDTLKAGAGLCNEKGVRILAKDGVERIKELIELGAPFDKDEKGEVVFGLEAAHSRRRVVHAHGDDTGRAISEFMREKVKSRVRILEGTVIDLLTDEKECVGIIAEVKGKIKIIFADATIVCAGGYAALYSKTSNPKGTTGSGIAMCYRAGAELADIEFVQFHPTTIKGKGMLISEAVRGEGALLVNDKGERFTENFPLKELSTRDVVSREIYAQMQNGNWVFLDCKKLGKEFLMKRFPTIYKNCISIGIDISEQLVPVEPAAHSCMGGVRTDIDGRTNIKRLYAAGECACTGVHGANRLASNSILEALVFGARAAQEALNTKPVKETKITNSNSPELAGSDLEFRERIGNVLWDNVGLVRSRTSLEKAQNELLKMKPISIHSQNALSVASLLVEAALMREESRGAHFRSDFPEPREEWKKQIILKR